MSLINCPECNNKISDKAQSCPHCGFVLRSDKRDNFIVWMYRKLWLQSKFEKNNLSNWKVNRGDIYACYFGENIGYEKSRLEARPCLIISTDLINHESGNIIVAPLSKNIKYKYPNSKSNELRYEWNYVLYKRKYTKLKCNSMVQCEDIRSVSKVRLGTFIDHVDSDDMKKIKNRIKKALQA